MAPIAQVLFALAALAGGEAQPLAAAPPVFLGINIPWHWFGYDIGGGAWDGAWFDAFFAQVAGKTNVARFFLHCDGRATPQFDPRDGFVVGLARDRSSLRDRTGHLLCGLLGKPVCAGGLGFWRVTIIIHHGSSTYYGATVNTVTTGLTTVCSVSPNSSC